MAWSEQETEEVLKAFAVACEVTGTAFSDAARKYFMRALMEHPAQKAKAALLEAPTREGKLSLAVVVKCIDKIDRKQLSDQRARHSHYLTTLRGLALVASIPWELGEAEVRRQLEAKGYKLEASPEKPNKTYLPAFNERAEREE